MVMDFRDNAGSDVVLGMLPLAPEFLRTGAQVVIAANRMPTINDITASELVVLLEAAKEHDEHIRLVYMAGFRNNRFVYDSPPRREALSSGVLRVVCSGSDDPVIDLMNTSEELAAECDGVDLVILEGMGRCAVFVDFPYTPDCANIPNVTHILPCFIRSIETNLHAKFSVDSWKLGMIKHPEVCGSACPHQSTSSILN